MPLNRHFLTRPQLIGCSACVSNPLGEVIPEFIHTFLCAIRMVYGSKVGFKGACMTSDKKETSPCRFFWPCINNGKAFDPTSRIPSVIWQTKEKNRVRHWSDLGVPGVTLQSFWLGATGGAMAMLTLNKALLVQATEQTEWLTARLHDMKMTYEVGGGVPYLLRDQAYVVQGMTYSKRNQTHWLCLCLQDQWNQGVHGLAQQLNRWLARKH
ncbi:hypothetical protein BC940DRAFT_291126 [Gongronella butleri]|nr:hypothetical protein BC940DRAFT_291126 [Gongronella butleri]